MSRRTVLVSQLVCVTIACLLRGSWADSLGVVLLDEVIFDKLTSRFPVSIVKFDTAFPYGEKHEQYVSFGREQNVLVKDLLIADVHVKDYGEKDNFSLLKRFRINEKQLPTILLFKSSDPPGQWVKYPADKEVTVDNLKNFVRTNTKLYIGLSGCVEEFDRIAGEFMGQFQRNEFADMDRLVDQAEKLLAEVNDDYVSKYPTFPFAL